MKRFKFKLEKLLEYREHLERQEENNFAQVLGEYVAIENIIKDSDSERVRILLDSSKYVNTGDLSLFFYREQAMKGLRVRMSENEKMLKEKEIPLNAAREKLVEARRQKKAIEILKDKAKKKYLKEVEKEEQDELDEYGALAQGKIKISHVKPNS